MQLWLSWLNIALPYRRLQVPTPARPGITVSANKRQIPVNANRALMNRTLQTNTQALKITEKKLLLLYIYLKMVSCTFTSSRIRDYTLRCRLLILVWDVKKPTDYSRNEFFLYSLRRRKAGLVAMNKKGQVVRARPPFQKTTINYGYLFRGWNM